MPYTTTSLMLLTLPAIGSRTNITSAHLSEFARRAESVINAKLGKLYTVPFSATPPVIEHIATEIGLYYALSRRVFTQEKKNQSEWVTGFKEAFKLLDDIASGAVTLIDSAGAIIAASTAVQEVWSNTSDYLPTITEDSEILHDIDPDKIDDLRQDRDQWP